MANNRYVTKDDLKQEVQSLRTQLALQITKTHKIEHQLEVERATKDVLQGQVDRFYHHLNQECLGRRNLEAGEHAAVSNVERVPNQSLRGWTGRTNSPSAPAAAAAPTPAPTPTPTAARTQASAPARPPATRAKGRGRPPKKKRRTQKAPESVNEGSDVVGSTSDDDTTASGGEDDTDHEHRPTPRTVCTRQMTRAQGARNGKTRASWQEGQTECGNPVHCCFERTVFQR